MEQWPLHLESLTMLQALWRRLSLVGELESRARLYQPALSPGRSEHPEVWRPEPGSGDSAGRQQMRSGGTD